MGTVKTVLIIGGSGFLGTHLAMKLREGYKVFATYNTHPVRIRGITFLPLDINDPDWTKRLVYSVAPDIVIYAAGSNDAEAVEKLPKQADQIHVAGPAAILKAANIFQPKFLYLSNCYTFDGQKGNYHETDTIFAMNSLGKFKVNAENVIKGRAFNYSVLRMSPVFGRSAGNAMSFLDKLRMKLSRGQRIEIPTHEIHSFLPVPVFVDAAIKILELGPRNKTYHLSGITKCNELEFAKMFAKAYGFDSKLLLEMKYSNTTPIPTLDYSLNCTEIVQSLKVQTYELEESFELLRKTTLVQSPKDAYFLDY